MGGNRIYLERINAMACRDYRCFNGKHEFRFVDPVTQLRGPNASGKTTILNLIGLALDPDLLLDQGRYSMNESNGPWVVELDFQAGGKRHILYRVFKEIENLFTRLTIFEGDNLMELSGKEALDYIERVTLPHRLGDDGASQYNFIRTKEYRQMNPDKLKRMMNLINLWNRNQNSQIRHIYWRDGQIGFVNHQGCTESYEMTALGPKVMICNMINFAAIIHEKPEDEITKVVLIDDMFRAISSEYRTEMIELIKILSKEHAIQFITTENLQGISRSFQLDRPAIPRIYRSEDDQLSTTKRFHRLIKHNITSKRRYGWKI